MDTIHFQCRPFGELGVAELYAILRLRSEVFVVEQHCVYQDPDDCDQLAWHATGERDGKLLCYARILPPQLRYPTPSIGRVVTSKSARGSGCGRQIVARSIDFCQRQWPGQAITISAQQYLERFYRELRFRTVSEPYLEDDIPHLEMVRDPE